MRHPAPREFSYPQLSLENIRNRRNRREEVLCNYSGVGKWILMHKRLNLWPKVKRGRPERGESLQDKSPFLKF
jgi:hypothetical protein